MEDGVFSSPEGTYLRAWKTHGHHGHDGNHGTWKHEINISCIVGPANNLAAQLLFRMPPLGLDQVNVII
jgi:hypothetical protein